MPIRHHTSSSTLPAGRRASAWFLAMPNIAVAAFIVAMLAFLAWNARHDREERQATLIEDVLWQEQTLRLHLRSNEDALGALAREIAGEAAPPETLRARAEFIARTNPEIVSLEWVGPDGAAAWSVPPVDTGAGAGPAAGAIVGEAFRRGRLTGRVAYSALYGADGRHARFALCVPAFRGTRFAGALVASYSVGRLLDQLVPWWYARRYELQVVDLDGRVRASKLGLGLADAELTHQVQFDPPGHGLLLRAIAYKDAEPGVAERGLVAVVVALSVIMVWSLWALRRHMAERSRAEQAYRRESSFRKAMEDSMVTAMRAVDMEGRITYVNQAFCRMVGMSADELVGCRPPMPYWSPDAEHHAGEAFGRMLDGRSPAGGVEHRFVRRGGEPIDVLVYSSPLIDADGRQAGWMSSINDITERKRAREALQASHERFVAVLDNLDAAVSVTDPGGGELLFANRGFRSAFCRGPDEQPCRPDAPWSELAAHALAASEDGSFDLEVRSARDQRWFHVRGHPITWVDGRRARLEVATDITARKAAEDFSRQQLERLQFTSRLVSMGEMASSVAHELNQPLSAIASYATGCTNLLRSGAFDCDELAGALDKIGAQAQRAGRIIRGIREFVRKAEPQLEPCQVNALVEEAAGFAEIEASRRGVSVEVELGERLPSVLADRTMLQQVVHNLVRNGVEAMADAPAERRRLVVRTRAREGGVAVEVADHGPGVPPDLAERLFEPFFTTKAEGMGMGLNICRSIVEYHHGRLAFEPNAGGGTVFRVSLPALAMAPAAAPAAGAAH